MSVYRTIGPLVTKVNIGDILLYRHWSTITRYGPGLIALPGPFEPCHEKTGFLLI